MIKYNVKRGFLTGLVFALVGFIFPVMVFFMSNDPTTRRILYVPCMPAGYILGHYMTNWEMAHGGVIYIPFINTLLYGILGCLLGTFSDVRRYVIHFCVAIGTLAIVSISIINARESLKRNQEIESMKAGYEQRLKTNPNEVHSLFWLGVHHYSRTHNYREAKNYFEKVLTLAPPDENSDGYIRSTMLYLVIILKSEGQDEQANQMYTRFLATQPNFKNNCTLFNINNEARMKLGLPQQSWESQQ
jgi:tetratricopeptide (TPR) repeat protein